MRFQDAYKNIESKFTSGNPIPVERAVITREEWDAINKVISELEGWLHEQEGYCECGEGEMYPYMPFVEMRCKKCNKPRK